MPSRRALLAGAAAGLGLSALPAAPVFAQAKLRYDLAPIPVLPGVWMIEGVTDYFS